MLREILYHFIPVRHRFRRIYRKNQWGSAESRSGEGSTLEKTQNIRTFLEKLIEEYGIRSIVDVACGDVNWMSEILVSRNLQYLGFDIVPDLIDENRRRYGSNRVSFEVLNIINEVPPRGDLIVFRDCMLHLSFHHGQRALRNIKASGTPLVLMTNWPATPRNEDIESGRWRAVNLTIPPFSLPRPDRMIEENERGKVAALWRPEDW